MKTKKTHNLTLFNEINKSFLFYRNRHYGNADFDKTIFQLNNGYCNEKYVNRENEL